MITVDKYLEKYKQLVENLSNTDDQAEYQDQIIQLSSESEYLVTDFYSHIQNRKEKIAYKKRQLELLKSEIIEIENEINEFEEALLSIIEITGEDLGESKKIEVGNIRYYRKFSTSVKSNLDLNTVPSNFIQLTIKTKLSNTDILKIEALLENKLEVDKTINKKALTEYAKRTQTEELYLERKSYLSQ